MIGQLEEKAGDVADQIVNGVEPYGLTIQDAIQLSIAISLRKIADNLENDIGGDIGDIANILKPKRTGH